MSKSNTSFEDIPKLLSPAIALIAEERRHQIEDLFRTPAQDIEHNANQQLSLAASMLCLDYPHICLEQEDVEDNHCPEGWSKELWIKMVRKSRKERLVIAAALLAAEIDREDHLLHELEQPKP